MVYEADENYPKALQILNDIIKQDNTNSAAKKRKIAIFKTLGRYTEAIKELTEYLKTYVFNYYIINFYMYIYLLALWLMLRHGKN